MCAFSDGMICAEGLAIPKGKVRRVQIIVNKMRGSTGVHIIISVLRLDILIFFEERDGVTDCFHSI